MLDFSFLLKRVLQWPLSLHNITAKETIIYFYFFAPTEELQFAYSVKAPEPSETPKFFDRRTSAVSQFAAVKAAFHPPRRRTPTPRPTKESSVTCRRSGMPNIWSKRDGNSVSPQRARLALECVHSYHSQLSDTPPHQHHQCTRSIPEWKWHFLASVVLVVRQAGAALWHRNSDALSRLKHLNWNENDAASTGSKYLLMYYTYQKFNNGYY